MHLLVFFLCRKATTDQNCHIICKILTTSATYVFFFTLILTILLQFSIFLKTFCTSLYVELDIFNNIDNEENFKKNHHFIFYFLKVY